MTVRKQQLRGAAQRDVKMGNLISLAQSEFLGTISRRIMLLARVHPTFPFTVLKNDDFKTSKKFIIPNKIGTKVHETIPSSS